MSNLSKSFIFALNAILAAEIAAVADAAQLEMAARDSENAVLTPWRKKIFSFFSNIYGFNISPP